MNREYVFPHHQEGSDRIQFGLELRDHIAVEAMKVLLKQKPNKYQDWSLELAKDSYEAADKMIKARKAK